MDKNSPLSQPALQNFDSSIERPASFIFKLELEMTKERLIKRVVEVRSDGMTWRAPYSQSGAR